MMKTLLSLAGLTLALTLAACGGEKGQGGLSPEEERGLNDAAEMLDGTDTVEVPDDSLVANEAEIAAEENQGAGNGQ